MNLLAAVLGYDNPIPDAPVTRSHRIGFDSKYKYVEPKPKGRRKPPPKKPSDALTPAEKRVFKMLKTMKVSASSSMIAGKTLWTRNHCHILLAGIAKKGLAIRFKAK